MEIFALVVLGIGIVAWGAIWVVLVAVVAGIMRDHSGGSSW